MNKSILVKRQNETVEYQQLYDESVKELNEKTKKLLKYQDIVKTFNTQIKMFEDFQTSAIKDIDRLKNQVNLFQDLYQKEKLEKESLLKRCRPTERQAAAKSALDNYKHKRIDSKSFEYVPYQDEPNNANLEALN